MSRFIKTKAVKDYALKCAHLRYKSFTRVRRSFLEDIDLCVSQLIERKVRNHPSIGKSLSGPNTKENKDDSGN